MRVLLLLALAALSLTGCRKKSSPEFYKLESAQSVLIARDGDDAYVSPEMDTILAGLRAVPTDAIEGPKAQALIATLTTEKNRVAGERVETAKPPPSPTNPFANSPALEPTPPPEPEPVAAVDAGEPEPYTGMDEATFAKLYGSCFSKGPPTTVGRGIAATTQLLAPSVECQKRLGTPGSVISYVFVDGGVYGKLVETTTIIDAGQRELAPPPPQAPAIPDAGAPVLTIPGAPVQDGYQKSTVY